MPQGNPIDDIASRLADLMPPGLRSVRYELEDNFKAVLQGRLAELNLVTREEFEVQATILDRARKKLTDLEARVAELEAKLSEKA